MLWLHRDALHQVSAWRREGVT